MIEIVRDHARRMKRYSSGEMALRWAAAGMLAAERQFRRVKGFAKLPKLPVRWSRPPARWGWRHRPEAEVGLIAGAQHPGAAHQPILAPQPPRSRRGATRRAHTGGAEINPRCRWLRTPRRHAQDPVLDFLPRPLDGNICSRRKDIDAYDPG